MKMSGFWGNFEEDAGLTDNNQTLQCQTQTRQREEPDQRNDELTLATQTRTFTREEPDQDVGGGQYLAISNIDVFETQTLTEQREEPEQDIAQAKYAIFSR